MKSSDVAALIRDAYGRAIFVPVFSRVKIDEINCGAVKVGLEIDSERHLNKQGFVQSGVFTALADVASRVAAASVGISADTLSFSINLTKSFSACTRVKVNSQIKHHGRRTVVIASEITDENDFLLATALNTMSVDGFFDEIPRKW